MKNILNINRFIFIFLAASALFACNKDKSDTALEPLKLNDIEIEKQGEEKTISFTARKNWTASVNGTWVEITPNQGAAGDVSLKLNIKPNSGAIRTSQITIKEGDVISTFKITQKSGFYIILESQEPIYFTEQPSGDIKAKFSVKANLEWEVDLTSKPAFVESVSITQGGEDGVETTTSNIWVTYDKLKLDTENISGVLKIKAKNPNYQTQVLEVTLNKTALEGDYLESNLFFGKDDFIAYKNGSRKFKVISNLAESEIDFIVLNYDQSKLNYQYTEMAQAWFSIEKAAQTYSTIPSYNYVLKANDRIIGDFKSGDKRQGAVILVKKGTTFDDIIGNQTTGEIKEEYLKNTIVFTQEKLVLPTDNYKGEIEPKANLTFDSQSGEYILNIPKQAYEESFELKANFNLMGDYGINFNASEELNFEVVDMIDDNSFSFKIKVDPNNSGTQKDYKIQFFIFISDEDTKDVCIMNIKQAY